VGMRLGGWRGLCFSLGVGVIFVSLFYLPWFFFERWMLDGKVRAVY